MTAEEKASLARLLGLASAASRGGYADAPGGPEIEFSDDPADAREPAARGSAEPADTSAFALGPAPAPEADSLELVAADARACAACRLAQGRRNAAPGEGAERPAVMVIGEGPGADEDATGRPFVGRAGQLLDKMLAAIGLSRESNCYIANVVKCRPPGNREPMPDEISACARLLERQARLLRPAFALCAGRVAAQAVLGSEAGIGKLRGRVIDMEMAGLPVRCVATYHPSAILRNEGLKRPAWEDLKLLRAAMEEAGVGPAEPG